MRRISEEERNKKERKKEKTQRSYREKNNARRKFAKLKRGKIRTDDIKGACLLFYLTLIQFNSIQHIIISYSVSVPGLWRYHTWPGLLAEVIQ